ncbi:MAG: class I SAM-dependent methyltransferase, partial [Pseudomonadota bacterium]|nr:class I SAM-dependent methyltransferase [Pseudomonadota bacterium]
MSTIDSDLAQLAVAPADSEAEFLAVKYGDLSAGGWGPRLRAQFGHVTPDDRYEYVVSQRVTPGVDWLDVGCGRHLFPHNMTLAERLAERCGSLTGIDPSKNVFENELLDARECCLLQDFKPGRRYDLVTLRMVVEHIEDPVSAAAALAALVRPGGHVIIYTVNRMSPVSLLSAATPTSLHIEVKRALWGGEDKDTFPTVYKMNTRRALAALFTAAGFVEERFEYLADTRVSNGFRWLNTLE